MKFKVVIAPDGQLQVIALEGTFDTASIAVKQLLSAMRAGGANIADESEPEQHRHDPEVTVNDSVHSH